MSFFTDALADPLISGGVVTASYKTITYVDGFASETSATQTFKARKSVQPMAAAEAQLKGYPDYATNEFYVIYTLKKLPLPAGNKVVVVHFNNKDWYVRGVTSWVWDEGTPFQQGYYEVAMSRYAPDSVNPDRSF